MDELYPYYEQELEFIRQMAGEFALRYPKVAGRLQLERDRCEDPHVERLLEGFALLAGRIQHKIDDEFPEVTESLLDLLYPHFLRPVPSMGIVQFAANEGQSRPELASVPSGTILHSRPAGGAVCTFRTCYPVEILPVRTADVSLSPPAALGLSNDNSISAAIRVRLETLPGASFSKLPLSRLVFHLSGHGSVTGLLYELLFANLSKVIVRRGDGSASSITLPASRVVPRGLSIEEAVLPYSDRSFQGYRLLQEYFCFPEKFLFVEVQGLESLSQLALSDSCELLLCIGPVERAERLSRLEQSLGPATFQLGCTPVVNLFEQVAEPIRLTHTKFEYRIVPDQHRQATTEVHSVNLVSSTANYGEAPEVYEPLYSIRHTNAHRRNGRFWFARRRPSWRKGDRGTDVYLTLVDLDLKPDLPPVEMLTVRLTCTNRDLPEHLQWSGEWGELTAENQALIRIRFVRKPTPAIRPSLTRGLHWHLISHLSLNHLSIVSTGKSALQEILRLYDFADGDKSLTNQKEINGITNLASRQCVSRVISDTGVAFCRGLEVELEFDEEQYAGSGVLLFASVLERFLGLYSTINSFSRLTVRTRQRKGVLKQWAALAGEQRVL
jgi:type VI secretion system protein ImpG